MYQVFIYCGGKCVGSTLCTTFNKNEYNTIHVHSSITWVSVSQRDQSIYEVINSSHQQYNQIFIIDSYRNPIERKISSFFQNITILLPDYKNMNTLQMIVWFNSNFLNENENYHPLNEVLAHYNVPLFTTYDFYNKYNIVTTPDNKTFIKLRFKDINSWDTILSRIFDKNIIVHPDNLTANKDTYELYTQFKKLYKLPKTYIQNIINDTEFKIYNTPEEQEKYIEYWSSHSY